MSDDSTGVQRPYTSEPELACLCLLCFFLPWSLSLSAVHIQCLMFVIDDARVVWARPDMPSQIRPLRLGLRDTLVRGWLQAVQGLEPPQPLSELEYEVAYSVMTLAIILTWDVIA